MTSRGPSYSNGAANPNGPVKSLLTDYGYPVRSAESWDFTEPDMWKLP